MGRTSIASSYAFNDFILNSTISQTQMDSSQVGRSMDANAGGGTAATFLTSVFVVGTFGQAAPLAPAIWKLTASLAKMSR